MSPYGWHDCAALLSVQFDMTIPVIWIADAPVRMRSVGLHYALDVFSCQVTRWLTGSRMKSSPIRSSGQFWN